MSEGDLERDSRTILQGQRGVGMGDTLIGMNPKGAHLPAVITVEPGSRALELGFGQGEALRKLKGLGCHVWGIDGGRASLEGACNPNAEEPGKAKPGGFIDEIPCLWMDISRDKFPFLDNFFDVVFCTETIEHLENPYHAMCEAKRVLRPSGTLVISFPRYEDNGGYDGGEHAFVYPGLFTREGASRFFMQLYFRRLFYDENGATAYMVFENVKQANQTDPITVTMGNYKEEDLYGHVKNGWVGPMGKTKPGGGHYL